MIVEPTPTTPRSPLSRALRLGGLVLPVVLLAGAVGAGVLGRRPDAVPPAPSPGIAIAGGTPTPGVARSPDIPAAKRTGGAPAPSQFGDLATITAADLLASMTGRDPAALVAVAGFLRVDGPADRACPSAGNPLGPWCPRTGILADSWSSSTPPGRPMPPRVALAVPAGVRLPGPATASPSRARAGGAHVLVVGRVVPPAGPCAAAGGCGAVLVVERFAWVDGVRVGLTPLVADRLDTGTARPNPFTLVLDEADMPLSAALVWPDDVATLDREAAAAAAAGPPSEPVWYVRVLDGARGPGIVRRVRWMLLAERDLRVLASGRPRAVTAGGAPAMPAGPG